MLLLTPTWPFIAFPANQDPPGLLPLANEVLAVARPASSLPAGFLVLIAGSSPHGQPIGHWPPRPPPPSPLAPFSIGVWPSVRLGSSPAAVGAPRFRSLLFFCRRLFSLLLPLFLSLSFFFFLPLTTLFSRVCPGICSRPEPPSHNNIDSSVDDDASEGSKEQESAV